MAQTDKDTIYVDVDDEITSIIDKVRSSSGRIIALVLPKRASVFQSVVNMKLLKRAGDVASKRVVLITTEQNLMPLAGSVGLYVAATPQSKPEIPINIPIHTDDPETDEEASYAMDNAATATVGELSDAAKVSSDAEESEEVEAIGDAENKPNKRDHKLAVPNFNRFRLGLFLVIALIPIIIAGLYVCVVVLPKATIAITTNTSHINVSLAMTLDTNAKTLDPTAATVPAKSEQQEKTNSQQVPATGQKNTGTSASGMVTLSIPCAQVSGSAPTIQAGRGVSANGLTYITQTIAQLSHSDFTSGCHFTDTVPIKAIEAGLKYNTKSTAFTLAKNSSDPPSYASITGYGAADNGTDNFVKVVSQADIDGAKQKLSAADAETIKAALTATLQAENLFPLTATFKAGDPNVSTSANVGDNADSLTVTQAVTYTMLGVQKTDLQTLIIAAVTSQINTKDQAIADDGLNAATIAVTDGGTPLKASLSGVATVGPTIHVEDVKRQAKGKKIGDVKALLNAIPGVTSVDVRLSPFWVSTVPSDPTKVTVTVDKAS